MPSSSQRISLQDIAAKVREARRAAGLASFEAFCLLYLAEHFTVSPSSMHREISGLIVDASAKRGARVAIAAPRGYAKTTLICLAYALWCLVRKSDPFIVMISNTADQAVQLLANIKKELEDNPTILEDFPEVAEPRGRKPSPKRWREKEVRTRNDVLITVLGAGQRLRGRKHGKDRPSLIILDDVEGDQEAYSPELREKRKDWFEKAILKAGDTAHTNVFVVGTLLHYASLLATLVGIGNVAPQPGWTSRRYKAVMSWAEDQELWQRWENVFAQRAEHDGQTGPEAARAFFAANEASMLVGTQVLWPERESYLQLMEMRLIEGRASFDSEKQNDPISAMDCLFNPDKFSYWDDQYKSEEELIAAFGPSARIYGACDPSMGKQGHDRDDMAIITLLQHPQSKRLYVLDALIEKRKPSQILDLIQELHGRRRFSRFGIEVNQFQENLADQLEKQCARVSRGIRLLKIRNSQDKVARIQGIEPLVTLGMIVFNRKQRMLLEQMRQFPRAAHDDGPDALEMAVAAAKPDPMPTMSFM